MALVQHYPALSPPDSPVCSVCIANYNGVALLADCIESVLAQQGGMSVEILVHDDASTDGSVSWLREHYPQVELLASSENVGFCVSNNRMAERARGGYVLLLNNDAALQPDALETLLREATQSLQAGIFTLPQYDWTSGALVDRGCLLDPFYNPVPNLDPSRTDVAMVIGACLFLPRALWNELGGFPEWIDSIGEDLYLCCIARLRDVPVRAVVRSGYRHRQGASFGGNRAGDFGLHTTYRRRALSERNKTAVMAICTPPPLAWLLLGAHIALLAVEGILLSLLRLDWRIWGRIYGAALTYAIRAPFTLRQCRCEVQATRRINLRTYLHAFTWVPRKLSLLWRHGVPRVR